MNQKSRAVWEVSLFTAGVASLLWIPYTWWAIPVAGVLLVATALAFLSRSETISSLGLGPRLFVRSLDVWKVWYLSSLAGLVIIGGNRLLAPGAVKRGILYFVWCVVQQLLYQNMVAKPLWDAFPKPVRACGISALMFALVHLPNPVLVPATFVWGAISCWLFRQHRSVIGLALLQTLLSFILSWIAPEAWSHAFRVGIAYFPGR